MKLNSITRLRPLGTIHDKNLLSEPQFILYSSRVLLFFTRILRDEIAVPNKHRTLSILNDEIEKLYYLVSSDTLPYHGYTHQDTKAFFNKVGLKTRHIRTE